MILISSSEKMKSPEVIVIGDGRMVPPKIGLRLATVEFRLRLEHRKKKKKPEQMIHT